MMRTTKPKPEPKPEAVAELTQAATTKTVMGRPRTKPTPISPPEAELRKLLGLPDALMLPTVCKCAVEKIKQLQRS